MKFFIAAFLIACAAMAAAQPLTDTEWRAEYGRYGIESVLPRYYQQQPLSRFRYVYPKDYLSKPFVAKASIDPEFFYRTYGFYPPY